MDRISEIISEAMKTDFIHDYEIQSFSISELLQLAELAHKHSIKVEVKAEYSNFAQGVFVQVYKWPLPWKPDFNNMPMKEADNGNQNN